MGLVDYHTHTSLCGHAAGAPEDYAAEAVKKNLAEIGFADHAPLPDGLREGITMLPGDTETYLQSVEAVREHYGDVIRVRTGFEVDFPPHSSFNPRYYTDSRIDFLIGSCHYLDGWAFDHPAQIQEFDRRDVDDVYANYYEVIGRLIDSRMFDIIGHLDLVKKFGHRARRDFEPAVRDLAARCARAGMTVEINTAGLRKPVHEIYPSGSIIAILFSENVPVTLGSDAHEPGETAYAFDQAMELIRKAGYRKISGFLKRRRYDIIL